MQEVTFKQQEDTTPPTPPEGAELVSQQGNEITVQIKADAAKGTKGDKEEQKQEQEPQKVSEEKPKDSEQGSKKETEGDETQQAVQKAGLDMDALAKEYSEKGELSEESLKKLEAVGITRETVNAYIAGLKAQAEVYTLRLAESLGGRQELEATLKWAGANLSKEEIESTNEILRSGNEAAARLVLAGLQSRRLEAVGREPSFVTGAKTVPGASGGIQPYASSAEMVADMSRPEYHNDPAFRANVMRRLAVSRF